MNSGTIIITIIFLAIVSLPFVISGNKRKKQKKNLLGKLSELAKKENCTITQHEFCGDFVIGLDNQNNYLFFYKKVENKEVQQSANLTDFSSCRVLKAIKTMGEKKEQYHVINKLELCFYPLAKSQPDVLIEFYNTDYDRLTLTGEIQLAEKWEKLLNEKMKNIKKPTTAPAPDIKTGSKKRTHKKTIAA
ncbi:hypothetical protein SAMN05444274_101451 [Mariniphaga anaerophila]|uniref:Uncharacterized protein n=1 Tax=Mariniphaga anaerophila TaxID=1484053 RepID=A0A1M4TSE9_9BACT|nr:hypothetical protein [Mariniphaga anaerophila]SHE47392.1 hypothetical protein SAMN05444274_101451 [Mariniphaga anaerophila]